MATLYLSLSMQKSFNHQHHVSCSSSPGLLSTFRCSNTNIQPFSLSSQKSSLMGLGFKSHEMGFFENGVKKPLGIQMSWDGPLTSVKLILQGKNFQLSPTVKSYVEKKLGRAIQKHSHLVREVDVMLSLRGGEFGRGPKIRRCEVTVFTKKHGVIRAEEDTESLYGSINLVSTITQKKLRKIKEKDSDHGRHMKGFYRLRVREPGPIQIIKDEDEDEVSDEGDENEDIVDEIVRTKYFDMPPLTAAEAIEQMENVDHDFYGFRNEETGEVNILYKREAGGYGLIIPNENDETEELDSPVLGSSPAN
ncbi:ribosome-binding factor psrp1 chloroplastic [Phtheirospermum japonicum]|uniref:Ribosome-binding factor psrp1 chloroplastic n=1 Tax=Phtheirospermum japonicum TaxID=374723 RepID=A0A830CCF0_9LAMI|nr:ribosome-binding factor psrp1 chloroplastic [Phtheirospermum japonicum]